MKTILLTFPDDKIRDRFIRLLKEQAEAMVGPVSQSQPEPEKRKSDSEMILRAIGSIKLDPPLKSDRERVVAIFVSGQKMTEGTLADLRKRFQQEVGSHSANVELRELRDGEWVTIQSRRQQRQQA